MSSKLEDLVQEAMRLSPDQRADLALRLLESAGEAAAPPEDDEETEEWEVDILKRISDIDAGKPDKAAAAGILTALDSADEDD